MDSDAAGPRVIRLPPYKFVHVLDTNSNVSRVLSGPLTYTRQEHEHVLTKVQDMIVLPAQHYVEIHNPVMLSDAGEIVYDQFHQAKLQHGEIEFRIFDKYPEPFPLYPGEIQAGAIKKLVVVPPDAALVIRATRKFDKYVAGDRWLFVGPATYVPRVEEEIEKEVVAIVIKKNQALKFRAEKKCVDALGSEREAGEEWLVRTPGAYLPQIDEILVEILQAQTLTSNTALHLCALQTFTDVYGIKRRAGEEWLVTTATAESHVKDVHELIIKTVSAITLTNRQYCVIVDPVVNGVQMRGTRELRKGETSFFLQPDEILENDKINDVYVLGEDEAVLLQASEPFVEKEAAKNKAEETTSSSVKREAGERWMVHGPREYIPPIQVEVLEIRKAIPLDTNEGPIGTLILSVYSSAWVVLTAFPFAMQVCTSATRRLATCAPSRERLTCCSRRRNCGRSTSRLRSNSSCRRRGAGRRTSQTQRLPTKCTLRVSGGAVNDSRFALGIPRAWCHSKYRTTPASRCTTTRPSRLASCSGRRS